MKQGAELFRVAAPGARHEIGMQVAEGDLVVSQIVGRGVHAGELLGIPATNREVETQGIAIHRVRDGKIVEYWSVTDVARVLQQLGVMPERTTRVNGLRVVPTGWAHLGSILRAPWTMSAGVLPVVMRPVWARWWL